MLGVFIIGREHLALVDPVVYHIDLLIGSDRTAAPPHRDLSLVLASR
jgi:hypothetical protein